MFLGTQDTVGLFCGRQPVQICTDASILMLLKIGLPTIGTVVCKGIGAFEKAFGMVSQGEQ